MKFFLLGQSCPFIRWFTARNLAALESSDGNDTILVSSKWCSRHEEWTKHSHRRRNKVGGNWAMFHSKKNSSGKRLIDSRFQWRRFINERIRQWGGRRCDRKQFYKYLLSQTSKRAASRACNIDIILTTRHVTQQAAAPLAEYFIAICCRVPPRWCTWGWVGVAMATERTLVATKIFASSLMSGFHRRSPRT